MIFWFKNKTFKASPPSKKLQAEINDRQEKLDWFSHDAHQKSHGLFVGGGGVNLPILQGAVLKGTGSLEILDHDIIEASNISRQYPYSLRNVGKYKAFVAGKHFADMALAPLTVTARRLRFQEYYSVDEPPKKRPDYIICGVDNNPTRQTVSKFGLALNIPVIFPAVSLDVNNCYVYLQEPGQACWGCAFPEFINDRSYPCGVPGSFCILSVAAGHALHAIDSLICGRPREHNLRVVYLDGGLPDRTQTIKPRPDCPLCSSSSQAQPAAVKAA